MTLSGSAQSRPEESASNEGIHEESSCSAPPNKLPKLSISDDQAGVSEIEALPDEALVEVFKNFCHREILKTYIVPGLKKMEAYCRR